MDHSIPDNNNAAPDWNNRQSGDPAASSISGLALRILLIAALYVATAMIGLLFVIPSGYTSTFMPAAGFALAALLMCGNRCWPGIWLGHMLTNLWFNAPLSGVDISPFSIWMTALLAVGATLQAIIGASLTRRFLADTPTLSRDLDVWRFLLLGGPVACLVSATISSSVLAGLDRMAVSDIPAHWLLWWTGDTLGVLLFTPLTLLFWPGAGNLWQNRRGRMALPLLVAAVAMAVGQAGFARYEISHGKATASDLMDTTYENGITPLPTIIEPLRGLERFFTASKEVTRDEYALFTSRIIQQPGIDSVDWAPRVPAAERLAFEQLQQRAGLFHYRIFQLGQDNRPVDVEHRADYFPVTLTSPLTGNKALLGLDHGFEEPRRTAMTQAAESGEIVTTGCLNCLVTRQQKLLAYQPVYSVGVDIKSAPPTDRRNALQGFIVGEINVDRLFAPLARSASRDQVAFRVTDITPEETPRVLAGTLPAGVSADWNRQITFTNRLFLVEMMPIQGYWNPATTLDSRMFYLLSVVALILIVFSILSAAGRAMATEALVVSRTTDLENELRARRVTDAALRNSERDLEVTLNSIGDAVLATDASGQITHMNPVAEQLTGWPLGEALGRPVSEVFHIVNAETGQPVPVPIYSVLRTGETLGVANHTIIVARDGQQHHIADNAAPIRDQDGSVRGVVLVFRDVGNERKAEQSLKASKAKYREFIQAAPLGVFVQGGGNFVFINPMAADLLGADSPEQLLGKPVLDFVHPDSRDEIRERIRRLNIERKAVPAQEHTWYRLDGTTFRGEATAVPYTYENQPAALVLLQDVTERRETETALIQARQEAEQANHAKSAFLATMSHEIRTPMNGVIGMVEILAQSRLSSHQKDIVNTIRESATTLLTIIDDILDFSKIEAGRMELDLDAVSVLELVEGLCSSLLPVAASKGVELNLFISPEIPARLLADDLRLRQLLYNLLGNAIKFSAGIEGRSGEVSVRVEKGRENPFSLVFRIADNGIGMKPEALKNLFTPFTQAEISTTRRFGGTGLGLAICKRLVDMMQGEINAQSTFNEGSVLTVTLPLEVVEQQPEALMIGLAGVSCILVDHPQLHTADLRTYLQHAGADILVAESIESAARTADAREDMVVIVQYAGREHPVLPATANSATNVRHLVITRGQRRRARVEKDNLVTLDGNALRRHALLRAVAVAAGRASPEHIYDQDEDNLVLEDIAQLPTVGEARAQDRLILIAEDDEINQHVILQQLRLLGYVGEVAANGAEALQLWREGNYALLLTDLHMPEMDGYSLAQVIRNEEQGECRIPIIALTANALRGEENRALAIGMDAYLTKPVPLRSLRTTLEKWLPRPVPLTAGAGADPVEDEAENIHLVDVNILKQLVGDEKEIIQEFLAEYLDSARQLTQEVQAAFEAGDLRQVSALAHRLKSSSRSVGALVLGDLYAGLENAGKEANKAYISQQMQELETTLAMVEDEIRRLLTAQGLITENYR